MSHTSTGRSRVSFLPVSLGMCSRSGISVLSLCLLAATFVAPLSAQARGSMTGSVVDAMNGMPVDGAVIEVVGTNLRAESDARGGFVLPDLPVGVVTLRVAGPGYTTTVEQVEVHAIDLVHFEASLTPMEATLEGLLVTGRREARPSGEVRPTHDRGAQTAADLLVAEVPGLSISSSGGNVGAGSTVRIRGISTIQGVSAPSIYLDGIRITDRTEGPGIGGGISGAHVLQMISADDVESIRVLRGPAAAGRFIDAANGVILIETVRGSDDSGNDGDDEG